MQPPAKYAFRLVSGDHADRRHAVQNKSIVLGLSGFIEVKELVYD